METITDKNPDKKDETTPSKFIVRIRLRGNNKTDLYDPVNLQLRVGNWVLVETKEGLALGRVASNKPLNIRKKPHDTST